MSAPIKLRLSERLQHFKGPARGQLGVIYVIDRGKFEWQSVLLLASIRRCFGARVAVYPYVPSSSWDAIDPRVFAFHRANGVEPICLDDSAPGFRSEYRHGNKILACAQLRPEPFGLFVDTDVLFLRTVSPLPLMQGKRLGAVPVTGGGQWMPMPQNDDLWKSAYDAVGLDLPPAPLPYFNAGMIAFQEKPVFGTLGDQRFGERWLDLARRLDREDAPALRPWLDQVALGLLAGAEDPSGIVRLETRWNHSVTQYGQRRMRDTVVLHYHGGARGDRLRNCMSRKALDSLLFGDEIFGSYHGLIRALSASIDAHERPDYIDAPKRARFKQDWEQQEED